MAPLIFSVCTEPSETTPRHFVVLNVPCLQSAKTTAEIRIGIGPRMLNSRKAAPDTHSMMTHTSLAHTSSAHRQRARGGGSEAVEIDQRQQVLALQGVFGVSSQFQGPGAGNGHVHNPCLSPPRCVSTGPVVVFLAEMAIDVNVHNLHSQPMVSSAFFLSRSL